MDLAQFSPIHISETVTYLPGAKAILDFETSPDLFQEAIKAKDIEGYKVSPWGENNDLPNIILNKIEQSEVVSSNLLFNASVAYGLGIKPMMKTPEGLVECEDEKVNDFFEANDLNSWFFEQMVDINTFFQPFSEVILTKDGKQIVQLRHKEAKFSRWGVMNPKGKIDKHYYSAKWHDSPKKTDIAVTSVLDRYDPYTDLMEQMSSGVKDRKFIIPVNMPSPGRTYYPRPPWWTIFNSGWFDLSLMIPKFKQLLIKNQLTVKYVIYISSKYWDLVMKQKNINPTDVEAVKKVKQEEQDRITGFLNSEDLKGGAILALKQYVSTGNSGFEEKYIEIQEIKTNLKGGEYLEDSQEAVSVICYAQGVHPSIIGAVPGKNSSMSGTEKRELIMIKQSLMAPYRHRPMRVLNLIKRYNNWPKELVFVIQDYSFTSLDESKSGKQLNNNVQP
jgi:hypothetical protein